MNPQGKTRIECYAFSSFLQRELERIEKRIKFYRQRRRFHTFHRNSIRTLTGPIKIEGGHCTSTFRWQYAKYAKFITAAVGNHTFVGYDCYANRTSDDSKDNGSYCRRFILISPPPANVIRHWHCRFHVHATILTHLWFLFRFSRTCCVEYHVYISSVISCRHRLFVYVIYFYTSTQHQSDTRSARSRRIYSENKAHVSSHTVHVLTVPNPFYSIVSFSTPVQCKSRFNVSLSTTVDTG